MAGPGISWLDPHAILPNAAFQNGHLDLMREREKKGTAVVGDVESSGCQWQCMARDGFVFSPVATDYLFEIAQK